MVKAKHYYVMAEIINDRQIKVMAELGVWKSRFAKNILNRCNCIEQYWAIDQWELLGPEHGRMHKLTIEDWNNYYGYCCEMMVYFPQLRALRMKTLEAVKIFPDGYFDLVYVDSSHFYENAKADILAWFPKVKKGGLISGHDYYASRLEHQGVTKAVDEILGVVTTGGNGTWWKEV